MRVPLTRPVIDDADVSAVAEALRSGWLTQGPKTHEFEARVAEYVGAPHAVATSSATTALHLALVLAGIGPGDQVIVPSFSFIATANVVCHVGATPVFVDIRPDTYNLDERRLERAITPRTRAIMPVDQVGMPAELDEILAIARHHGLAVIEDAACALGSEYHGRRIGGISPLTVLSFHPRKVISTGEGGMLLTDDGALAARARSLCSHGESVSDLARHAASHALVEEYHEAGYNYRMTNAQGALGVTQMAKLDDLLARRARLAARYCAALAESPAIDPPRVPSRCRANWQSFMVRVTERSPHPRDALVALLRADGIQARSGVMAIHEQPIYRDLAASADLRETERAARETMMLPLFPDMSDEQQGYVIERLLAHLG